MSRKRIRVGRSPAGYAHAPYGTPPQATAAQQATTAQHTATAQRAAVPAPPPPRGMPPHPASRPPAPARSAAGPSRDAAGPSPDAAAPSPDAAAPSDGAAVGAAASSAPTPGPYQTASFASPLPTALPDTLRDVGEQALGAVRRWADPRERELRKRRRARRRGVRLGTVSG